MTISYPLNAVSLTLTVLLLFTTCLYAERTGFSLDFCTTNENCRPPRSCVFVKGGNFQSCNPTRQFCSCLTNLPLYCASSIDCKRGEACLSFRKPSTNTTRYQCVSCSWARRVRDSGSDTFSLIDDLSSCPPFLNLGLSNDNCTEDATCAPPRRCRPSDKPTCLSGDTCTCVHPSPKACTECTKCDEGELCYTGPDGVGSCLSVVSSGRDPSYILVNGGVCTTTTPSPVVTSSLAVSPSVTPSDPPSGTPSPSMISKSPSPSQIEADSVENEDFNGVCIGAYHLSHLPSDALVYRQHRRAVVLCDRNGSCATVGHVVVFDGRAMSMRRYCVEYVDGGCKEDVMEVNSPRMRRGLRVGSKTEALEFTAMAGRWGSLVEERVLSSLVWLGM